MNGHPRRGGEESQIVKISGETPVAVWAVPFRLFNHAPELIDRQAVSFGSVSVSFSLSPKGLKGGNTVQHTNEKSRRGRAPVSGEGL